VSGHHLGIPFTSRFSWAGWCDYGADKGLCIYGWDAGIGPPGPDFGYRTIRSESWHRLVTRIDWENNPFFDPSGPKLDILPWAEGMNVISIMISLLT